MQIAVNHYELRKLILSGISPCPYTANLNEQHLSLFWQGLDDGVSGAIDRLLVAG